MRLVECRTDLTTVGEELSLAMSLFGVPGVGLRVGGFPGYLIQGGVLEDNPNVIQGGLLEDNPEGTQTGSSKVSLEGALLHVEKGYWRLNPLLPKPATVLLSGYSPLYTGQVVVFEPKASRSAIVKVAQELGVYVANVDGLPYSGSLREPLEERVRDLLALPFDIRLYAPTNGGHRLWASLSSKLSVIQLREALANWQANLG